MEMIKIMMFWVLVKSYCDLLWCIQDYYIITSLRSCPLPIIPNCRLHHHMNHHLWFHSLNSFAYILYFDFLPWNLSCAIFLSVTHFPGVGRLLTKVSWIPVIPALPFWPETSRFQEIFLASHFHWIFSRFLKLFLAEERYYFLYLTNLF